MGPLDLHPPPSPLRALMRLAASVKDGCARKSLYFAWQSRQWVSVRCEGSVGSGDGALTNSYHVVISTDLVVPETLRCFQGSVEVFFVAQELS